MLVCPSLFSSAHGLVACDERGMDWHTTGFLGDAGSHKPRKFFPQRPWVQRMRCTGEQGRLPGACAKHGLRSAMDLQRPETVLRSRCRCWVVRPCDPPCPLQVCFRPGSVVKNAALQCNRLNGGDVSVTRNRLCTELSTEIGE